MRNIITVLIALFIFTGCQGRHHYEIVESEPRIDQPVEVAEPETDPGEPGPAYCVDCDFKASGPTLPATGSSDGHAIAGTTADIGKRMNLAIEVGSATLGPQSPKASWTVEVLSTAQIENARDGGDLESGDILRGGSRPMLTATTTAGRDTMVITVTEGALVAVRVTVKLKDADGQQHVFVARYDARAFAGWFSSEQFFRAGPDAPRALVFRARRI